jgi:hypothetical protein
VRDARYKYVRNHRPDTPYGQSIAFRNNLDTMQEILTLGALGALGALGELVPPADWYFVPTKPVEELYDTLADPDELENLAGRPEHAETLVRMRAAHDDRVVRTGDLGSVAESELAELYWPGGLQPVTAPPVFETSAGDSPGTRELTILSRPSGRRSRTQSATARRCAGGSTRRRSRSTRARPSARARCATAGRRARSGWCRSRARCPPASRRPPRSRCVRDVGSATPRRSVLRQPGHTKPRLHGNPMLGTRRREQDCA